jgi:alpha-1,2-mannosyltransferase
MKKIFPKILFILTLLIMLKVLFLNVYPDFNAYYYGSVEHNILNYPPFVTVIFSFFSFLPLAIASKVWTILSILFLLISLSLCFKLFSVKIFSSTALVLFSLVFIYFPVKFTLGMGQLNLLVLLFIVLTLYFYIKGRDSYSGVCLGISIMLKLFPVLLLLYFLLLRKYKIFIYSLVVFIGLGGISYLFIKPGINNYYWQHLFSIINSVPVDYYNQALSGFLARSIGFISLRNFLRIIISILLITFSYLVILRNRKRDLSGKTLEFGSIITLNVLVNGYSWQHHFVWLILPFLITFIYIRNKKLDVASYIFLGTSYLLTCVNIKNFTLYPAIIQSHMFYGAIILWLTAEYFLLKND